MVPGERQARGGQAGVRQNQARQGPQGGARLAHDRQLISCKETAKTPEERRRHASRASPRRGCRRREARQQTRRLPQLPTFGGDRPRKTRCNDARRYGDHGLDDARDVRALPASRQGAGPVGATAEASAEARCGYSVRASGCGSTTTGAAQQEATRGRRRRSRRGAAVLQQLVGRPHLESRRGRSRLFSRPSPPHGLRPASVIHLPNAGCLASGASSGRCGLCICHVRRERAA
jgi:hypothetical protein